VSRRYDLVIFDFDGTLADSLTWFRSAMGDVADKHGLGPMCEDRAESLRGLTPKQIMSELKIPAWKLPFIAADVRAMAAENVDQIKLYDGIPDVLRALHEAGVRIAVVSSNGETAVREVLGEELTELVSQFACGAALFGKASIFRKVMKRAGVSPDRTLSVGDEVRDIEAAREAGCDCAAVCWGFATPEILNQQTPDVCFSDRAEIGAYLDSKGGSTAQQA